MCLAATSRISFFETKAGFFLISSPYQVCWRIFWYNPRPQGIIGHKYTFEFFRPKTTCFCMEPKGSLKTTFPVRESGCFSRSGHSPTYRRVTQKWSDVPDLPSLFVFLKSDPKQNARSLSTPVSDPVFHALSHGSLSFALHGSFFNHFLIGGNSSTANQNHWNKWLLELPWRRKCLLPCERTLKVGLETGVKSDLAFCLGPFTKKQTVPFIWLFKILQRDQLHLKVSCFFFLQWFFFKFLIFMKVF